MARNNKNTYTYKNVNDVVRRAKAISKSIDTFSEDKFKATKEDIENIASEVIKGRSVVINSNVGTVNAKINNFSNKQANKNYEYSNVTKAIENLYANDFYSVISGKVSTGEDLMVKAIENNTKINIKNQRGKSNESLEATLDKYEKMKKADSFYVYDLETLGGVDAHGIWRPTHITEYSMHQYDKEGNVLGEKVDIVLGWRNEKEVDNLVERIEKAIADGSIEYDQELSVTAHRLSLYGDKRTRVKKDERLGYFKMENFIDSDEGDIRDIKRIKEGAELFKRIGKETSVDKYGIPADVRAMMESLSDVQRNVVKGSNKMIVDYNGSLHDLPIMNYVGNQMLDLFPSLRQEYFTDHNMNFNFNPTAENHFDFFGMMQHFRSNFSTKELLGDAVANISENRLNRQEHYVKALYEDLFNSLNLRPHEASSDVTALGFFFTRGSDKLGGKNLMEFMGEKLKSKLGNQTTFELLSKDDNHIFQAKAFNNGTFGGKNILNFAISQDGKKVFTADNHMIRDGVVQKKDFNVGTGIVQGAYYKLRGMGEFEASQQYIDTVKEYFPQYTTGKLYSVTLDMMTSKENKGTRLEDLSQVFIFNSETERDAFLGNTLNVVAKETEDGGYKILDRDAFDIREYDVIKGKPVYKDVNKNWAKSDTELVERAVKHENKKLLTSRAERAINGDNAYRKIGQALEIQELAKKTINRNITNRELNLFMAERVAAGQMPLGIDENLRLTMQKGIKDILEWNGEVYDSTIDNMSTYMDNIADNEAYYKKLFEIVKKDARFDENAPAAVKKELFKRADRHARETLANGIYSNEIRIKKSILGDESLQTSLAKFKNMYEIDLSKMPGAQRVFNYDVTQANPTHLLRLDLGKTANNDFGLVGGVMKALHGDKKFGKEQAAVENRDFRKFIGMILEDDDFNKSLNNGFRNELKAIAHDNAKYHHIDTADRIVKQFAKIKQANPFSGMISKELYMKELSSSSGFTRALNSDDFLNTLEDKITGLLSETKLFSINGDRGNAEAFVKNNLLQHYIPSSKPTEFIHSKVTQEMTDYLTEIVYSIDKIGASISINDYGDITMHDGGKSKTLALPRIKQDVDSGTWYINTGNMNNKLSHHLKTKSISGGYGVDLQVNTTFAESIGTYPMSKAIEEFHNKQGASATKDSMDYIESYVNSGKKKLIKNPTINSFNGNDANSNRLFHSSGVKDVLPELFGENGKLNYLVKNKKFLDSNLQELLGKDIAKHLQRGDSIEELDAYMTNTMAKNMKHILEILVEKAGIKDTEVGQLIKSVSFNTNDKQMSSSTGIVGDMPLFSPQAALDNIQRPPVLAAGNAIPVRMENAKKLQQEGSGVLAGNLISSASIDKATLKHVAGVGETTTDVMMDIAYVDTSALEILKSNNVNRVLSKNGVDENYKQRMLSMFSKMNTYEQERHLDGRIAERLYGLMPSKIQNISASKDIVSAIHLMDLDGSRKQLEDIIDVRGNITIDKSGVLSYTSATGKFVRRGENVVNILGYGDKLETISPTVKNGVFTHKYIKSNGMVLNDKEITEIINQNKDLFMSNGVLNNKISTIRTLEDLLSEKYSANGLYRIEDVSAAGFIKPTTSSTEKGMTNLNYIKTGSLNKDVDRFFKSIGMEDVSRQSVLTDEGIDAILKHVGGKKVQAALKENFGSVANLKVAIANERNAFNKFLIDDVFEGKAHMFVNDGVFKHGGAGQLQFGILNKALDNYLSKGNSVESAVKLMNESGFLTTRNLNDSKSIRTTFEVKDGRILMPDMGTSVDNMTISNIERLQGLIEALDSSLVHKDGYIRQWNEKEKKMEFVPLEKTKNKVLYGEWTTQTVNIDGKDQKVYISPVTKENVKLLPDVETQTGTENRYFELQEKLKVLRARKNSTGSEEERTALIGQIAKLESELKNYESVSKRMTIGSTEFQLLERIKVTQAHAQELQDLMNQGEEGKALVDRLLASSALKDKVKMTEGNLQVEGTLKDPVLGHWLKRFKGQLTYNPLQEDELTKGMADRNYKHLRYLVDNANKYDYKLGVETAEKIYQADMAGHAVRYNSKGDITVEGMEKLGFEVRKIDDIGFETDEIAKKNLLIDLGEEFAGKNRYIAVAGTGFKMNEDEEILTNGQKELMKLAHKHEEWKLNRYDDKLEANARKAVEEQAQEAIGAIRQSIYGKNAYMDKINKVQVDDVNYRYKASGAVTSELIPGLNLAADKAGLEINDNLLSSRYINIDGKETSLLDWHKQGAHYDYKFVSLEAMENMGMFNEDVMKGYGASNKEEMINLLKKYGTMDITDRYPNNKNDSMLLTHVFLDTDLVGNQTKVSGVSGLKMLLDHDGDSVSSFALRYKNGDGSFVDFGMFASNPEYVKKVNKEAYDTFSDMLGTTTVRAVTENKKWLNDVNKILVEDAIKNSQMGDLTKTALVPGGESILGKIAPAAISHLEGLDATNKTFEDIDGMLAKAKGFIESGAVETKINASDLDLTKDKSEFILDKALTVMQEANDSGLISKDELSAYESLSLKKVAVDKASIASHAKTGVATTGAINVATNSIKKAAHDTLKDTDPLTADIFRSILDIPEQEAISSKKIISAYDDIRARSMTEILGDMFGSNQSSNLQLNRNDMTDLRSWFETHAKGKIEGIYDEYKGRLDSNIVQKVESGGSKFNAVMNLFEEKLESLSNDEYFQGKRLHYKTRGEVSTGAANALDDYSAVVNRVRGMADESYLARAQEVRTIKNQVAESKATANTFHANSNMVKQTASATMAMTDALTKGVKVGGGIGTAVLGLAGGLMAAGYASGNPLNDKQASEVSQEQAPVQQTMSIPDFMDKQGGYVTGNTQQGYIINIKADTKKGRKHMQRIMKQAAEASVGGAVSVNMNIRENKGRGITDADIENFLDRHL